MIYVLKAIGILFLAIGIVFLVRPSFIRSFIDFAKVGKRIYIGGVIRLVLGALLLIGTPQATFPWITGVIGAIVVIAGILIFALGVQRVHGLMDRMYAKPDNALRILPIVTVVLGVLIIYGA